MAFGNGSHSLKRGFLRPNGGSRLPVFLIIALVAGCSFLLYNVYTTTVDRNSLMEELSLTKKKWQTCQRDKTELETRFETNVRSFKTMKDELERLRTVERNSNEVQKELKQCREQVLTLQNENSDLKEEQKTDVEGCQRKLKAAEEKIEPCMQEKSRLESEIDGLRSNLSAALQQAQKVHMMENKADDVQKQNTKVAESPRQESDSNVPPHRGVPADIPTESSTPVTSVLYRTAGSHRNESNASTGGDDSVRVKGQSQTSVMQSATDAAAKTLPNDTKKEKLSEDTLVGKSPAALDIAQDVKQSPDFPQPADINLAQANQTKHPAASEGPDTVKKQALLQNENETNDTAVSVSETGTQIDAAQPTKSMNMEAIVKRKKKKKTRRLNKVIEASAPADEKRRLPSDPINDRSRGEQDDAAHPSDSGRITLRAPMPNRINIEDRPGQPSDHEQKIADRGNDGKAVSAAFEASTTMKGIDGWLGRQRDESVTKLEDSKNKMLDDHQQVGLPPPIEKPAVIKSKLDARKGLKDDYQYRDDDEEAEASNLKNRPKKASENALDGLADSKNDNRQQGGDSVKIGNFEVEPGAKANEDDDLEKKLPKEGNADLDA